MCIEVLLRVNAHFIKIENPFCDFRATKHQFDTITKTRPGNVYPIEPHFHIAKLGYAGVYLFLSYFCSRRFERVPTIYVLSKSKKNSNLFQPKFSIFKAKKISVYCIGKFS